MQKCCFSNRGRHNLSHTCKLCARNEGNPVHWQFQQHKILPWALETPSHAEGDRTAVR